jgi:hypothetical protein
MIICSQPECQTTAGCKCNLQIQIPYPSDLLKANATAIEAKDAEIAALRERVKQAEACCDSYADENQKLHDRAETAERRVAELERERDEARAALRRLVNAKALAGVRALVAGWNGEGRDEPYKERHPARLGATLPKTNCGAVYELDEALTAARAVIEKE